MAEKKPVDIMKKLIEEKKKKSSEQGFWKTKKMEKNHPAGKK